MNGIDSGVKEFIRGKAEITVNFPVGWSDRAYVCCTQCPYLSSNERMCQLNKQPVQFPQRAIGYDCPLRFGEGASEHE